MEMLALFLRCATTRSTVLRALTVAGVVTPVLIAINHGGEILRGEGSVALLGQVVLTFCVPYCVSTFSSACVEMRHGRAGRQAGGQGP